MTPGGGPSSPIVSRRALLRGTLSGGVAAVAGPVLWQRPAVAGAGAPYGVHLQFGADASREVVVSWSTATSVARPRVRLGRAALGWGSTVPADTRAYVDGTSKKQALTHHARLDGLRPDTSYVYEVAHDGAAPVGGTFRTAPVGRARLRFTSFGDQGTGQQDMGALPRSSRYGAYVVAQIEALDPLFHLLNGDLSYADSYPDRIGAWDLFLVNNERSARNRPWMPTMGNHELESGNGPLGAAAYRSRFALPANGTEEFSGHWYTFRAGAVQVVSIDNDDVVYQEASTGLYVRGYSAGAQRPWLERTLAGARADPAVDWVVVVMHQLVMSSAVVFNGPDLGVREEFAPLFDRYGVDLVLCGHDHHYERTHPVRGVDADTATLRPSVVATDIDVVDTEQGTVHLVVGGGGGLDLHATTAIGVTGQPVTLVHTSRGGLQERDPEIVTWSAVRDHEHGYGFVSIDVDPGEQPGGTTQLLVTYYRTAASMSDAPTAFDRVTLRRRRRDGVVTAGPGAPAAGSPDQAPGAGYAALPATGAPSSLAAGAAAALAAGAAVRVVSGGAPDGSDHLYEKQSRGGR